MEGWSLGTGMGCSTCSGVVSMSRDLRHRHACQLVQLLRGVVGMGFAPPGHEVPFRPRISKTAVMIGNQEAEQARQFDLLGIQILLAAFAIANRLAALPAEIGTGTRYRSSVGNGDEELQWRFGCGEPCALGGYGWNLLGVEMGVHLVQPVLVGRHVEQFALRVAGFMVCHEAILSV